MRPLALVAPLAAAAGLVAIALASGMPPAPRSATFGAFVESAAIAECGEGCFEPAIAVAADGTIYVSDTADDLARSSDGGVTWTRFAAPPRLPSMPSLAGRGDQMLAVAPDGTLYYAALLHGQIHEWVAAALPEGAARPVRAVAFFGVQVATSVDRGASWKENVHLSPAGGPRAFALPADRPWLAFGSTGEAYLTYRSIPAPEIRSEPIGRPVGSGTDGGIWVARSDDAGATWRPPVLALAGGAYAFAAQLGADYGGTTNGNLALDSAGRIFVVAFGSSRPGLPVQLPATVGENAVIVARSTDGGLTFQAKRVEGTGPSRSGSWAPSVTVAVDDAVYVAGKSLDGRVRTFASFDHGASWSAGAVWNEAPAEWGVFASAGPRGLDALWFEPDGAGGARLVAARSAYPALDGSEVRATLANVRGVAWSPDAFTDFAFAARLPSGGLAAVWSDSGRGDVTVTLES